MIKQRWQETRKYWKQVFSCIATNGFFVSITPIRITRWEGVNLLDGKPTRGGSIIIGSIEFRWRYEYYEVPLFRYIRYSDGSHRFACPLLPFALIISWIIYLYQ